MLNSTKFYLHCGIKIGTIVIYMKLNKMEKDFVPYNLSMRLKELGFDEPCLASYYTDIDENNLEGKRDYRKTFNGIEYHPLTKLGTGWEPNFIRNTESVHYVSAPTFRQAFRWFRDNYGFVPDYDYYGQWNFEILRIDEKFCELQDDLNLDYTFKGGSYEEAQEACLDKMCEILETKNIISNK